MDQWERKAFYKILLRLNNSSISSNKWCIRRSQSRCNPYHKHLQYFRTCNQFTVVLFNCYCRLPSLRSAVWSDGWDGKKIKLLLTLRRERNPINLLSNLIEIFFFRLLAFLLIQTNTMAITTSEWKNIRRPSRFTRDMRIQRSPRLRRPAAVHSKDRGFTRCVCGVEYNVSLSPKPPSPVDGW